MLSKPKSEIACIILAAGAGSRFGGAKLEYRLPSGQTILQQTITKYLDAFEQVLIVIKERDQNLREQVEIPRVNIVETQYAHQGMSQSLRVGVRESTSAAACMIALGDMPYIKVSTIQSLIQQASEAKIVQPISGARAGNPVIFGSNYYSEILSLQGDKGAKQLLSKHAEHLLEIEVNDPGIHHDIDRIDDVIR